MNKPFDVLVFIGRFQPYHLAHQQTILQALQLSRYVFILIGSAYSIPTLKNPFSFEERQDMILAAHPNNTQHLKCFGVKDFGNDVLWSAEVKRLVSEGILAIEKNENTLVKKIGIIGHNKDESTYYLKLFLDWQWQDMPNHNNISATPIRQHYWQGLIDAQFLPETTVQKLQQWQATQIYKQLQDDYTANNV